VYGAKDLLRVTRREKENEFSYLPLKNKKKNLQPAMKI